VHGAIKSWPWCGDQARNPCGRRDLISTTTGHTSGIWSENGPDRCKPGVEQFDSRGTPGFCSHSPRHSFQPAFGPCAQTDRGTFTQRISQMTKQNSSGHSTMSTGAPAPSDRNSLTIGPDGPILLHDVHFLEQMAHFNREKVPERQPHAKGSGAFGVFETTEDVSAFTKAALFRKGARTDMLARFSTVA